MSIISFEHKFVFLKTRKVAGTSVEALLRKLTGSDDIVPAVTPRDEYFSAIKGDYSKNYLTDKKNEEVYTQLVLKNDFEEAEHFLSSVNKIASSHMTYERIEKIIANKGLSIDEFYVFTIERHPYSWLLSKCLYNNKKYNTGVLGDDKVDVGEVNKQALKFLSRSDVDKMLNWHLYSSENKVLVDRVLKYENLENDLKECLEEIGFSIKDLELPDLKNNARHLDASEMLSQEVKDKAIYVFKNVFDSLGYSV